MKKILSVFLCAIMVIAMVPASVFVVSAANETLYSNDFSSETDGLLSFAADDENATWSQTIETNGTNGIISVKLDVYPKWVQSTRTPTPIISINETTVLVNCGSASSAKVGIGANVSAKGDGVSSANYNESDPKPVPVIITIYPETGDFSIYYQQKAMSSSSNRMASGNLGFTIQNSFTITLGNAAADWKADNLVVTQTKSQTTTSLISAPVELSSSATEWSKDITTEYNGGSIFMSFDVNAQWYSGNSSSILSVNGNTILWNKGTASNRQIGFGTEGNVSTQTANANTSETALVRVYVLIDKDTGDASIYYRQSTANASSTDYDTVDLGITINVGPIGDSFNITFGSANIAWTLQNLVISEISDDAQNENTNDNYVKITGYQQTKVSDDKYNVRFIAAVGELVAGQENIGFEITTTADGGKTWNKTTNVVYNSITANYGTETVNASDPGVGGKYVTAMAITGIPANLDKVVFVVKPYTTINGVKHYGAEVTVTVNPIAE